MKNIFTKIVTAIAFMAAVMFGFPVGLALARDRKRINVKGGGKWQLREISPTPSDTFLDLGYLTSSTLTDEHGMVESNDEAGNVVENKSGSRKVTGEIVLKQSGADEINLLRNAEGKYYEMYYSVSTASGTLVQELSIPLCRIKPGPVLDFKAGTERPLKLMLYALAPKADFVRTPTAFNVTANDPYVLTEGANVNGAPSDTASALAAGVL